MKPSVIGVAGGSGSGKSTVARNVAAALGNAFVALVDMDAYYVDDAHLPLDERRAINWDHPNTFDLELLVQQLAQLAAGSAIDEPTYDFLAPRRGVGVVRTLPADAEVVDGILLFADARLRALCDVKVFVDADRDVRLIRRIRRDMAKRGRPFAEILDQYLATVQPMHLEFAQPSKRYADVMVPRGGRNTGAVEMLVAKIARRLAAGPSAS